MANIRRSTAALILIVAITVAVLSGASRALRGQAAPDASMDACTRNDALFPGRPTEDDDVRSPPEYWRDLYHTSVGEIVQEHLETSTDRLVCTDDPHVVAGPRLTELAQKLQPWKDSATAFDDRDLPAILLAYLRAYECTLYERSAALLPTIANDVADGNSRYFDLPAREDGGEATLSPLVDQTDRQTFAIAEELAVARSALHRTLASLASRDRLQTLRLSFQCFERASLDIQSVFRLVSDAASCLPKIWNARDPLRDLQP